MHQIHSADVITVNSHSNSDLVKTQKADGLISLTPHKSLAPLCIVTADCIPIVMLGKKGVAFLHAGWRGVQSSIFLHKNIPDIEPTYVFLGPSIRKCCFEVQKDFYTFFPNSNHHFEHRNHKIYFDLIEETKEQLLNHFPRLTIEDSAICTCCNLAFHSYRRDKTSLRNYNLLSQF